MLIRNSFSVLRLVFLLRIHRQKDAIAECGLKPFNRAILIPATARAAADTDGADHLAVNDDGNTARIRKKAELDLLQLDIWILDHSVHPALAGLTSHQGGARLHLRGDDVEIPLAVHTVHVNLVSVVIKDVDADC